MTERFGLRRPGHGPAMKAPAPATDAAEAAGKKACCPTGKKACASTKKTIGCPTEKKIGCPTEKKACCPSDTKACGGAADKKACASLKKRCGLGADECAKVMAKFDKDGDGKLTREEYPEQYRRMFDRLDTNKDGAVSLEEDIAHRTQRMLGAQQKNQGRGPPPTRPEPDHADVTYGPH